VNEKNLRLQEENRMRQETQKIREDQISDLVAALIAQKSEFDSKDISKVIGKKKLPKDIEDKIQQKKDQLKKSKPSSKKIRFEDHVESDTSSNPDVIQTGGNGQATSLFKKAKIKRTQPLTPKDKKIDLASKLKDEDSYEVPESSLESIPYSDDFEADESLAVSKPKGLLKTRSEITESIPDYDEDKNETIKDTITEKIGGRL